jgi:hypothetical protein
MELTVTRTAEGDVELHHVPPALAYALRELPALLSEEFPASASRIEQDPFGGQDDEGTDERAADWVRHGHPELRHLFDSAREIVIEDLKELKREGLLPPRFTFTIPAPNLNAWLSALAAARVGLGEVHEVEPGDLERFPDGPFISERGRGILLIQLLGWLQEILLG